MLITVLQGWVGAALPGLASCLARETIYLARIGTYQWGGKNSRYELASELGALVEDSGLLQTKG